MKPQSLIGKLLLIGLTVVDGQGKVLERKQLHGRVRSVSDQDGIVVDVEGEDEPFTLPPDLSAIRPVPPGEYREKSTGKVVKDADYMVFWRVTRATNH